MDNGQNVTQAANGVTCSVTASRAQETLRVGVTMSRVTTQRDVTDRERDSDNSSSPSDRSRHGHGVKQEQAQKPATWLHIAAMNLLADHEAGIHVEQAKLDTARRILGRAA